MIDTELFTIPYEDKYIVYAPLRKVAFLTNAHTVSMISRFKGKRRPNSPEEKDLLDFFSLLGISSDIDDFPVSDSIYNTTQPTSVTLFLSSVCNLACVYCYAAHTRRSIKNMDFLTAKAGIDVVCRNARKSHIPRFEVIFHGGGEFTQNWKVLTDSVQYATSTAKKAGVEAAISGASNGVFSKKQCRWLMRHFRGISISVDGLPEIHDAQRPLSSGAPSSKFVFDTLETFSKADFPFIIRLTATADSIDRLPSSIAYLLSHASPEQIAVEPVYPLGGAENAGNHLNAAEFVFYFRKSKRVADQYGIPLRYSAARIDVLTDRFCTAGDGNFCITPSGQISVCYLVTDEHSPFSETFLVGHDDESTENFSFSEDKLKSAHRWELQNREWCRECFAKWHCAGDCPNLARHAADGGMFMGHERCEITRALLLDQLLEKIEASGGFVWAPENPFSCLS